MTFHSDETPRFDRVSDGLLPTIIQDAASGTTLMSVWMNHDAWRETLRTGFGVYYSLSTRSMWRKGESAGKRHKVVDVHVDDGAGTILLQVQQVHADDQVCISPLGASAATLTVSKAK